MHQRALKGYEKVLGPEHPDTLSSVSSLGSMLERQGKYEEAKAMHQRALKGREKVLGLERPHAQQRHQPWVGVVEPGQA